MISKYQYRLYGQRLVSNTPLPQLQLDSTDGPADVRYSLLYPRPLAQTSDAKFLRRMELSIGGWLSQCILGDSHLLQFEDRAEFSVSADGSAIECRPAVNGIQPWIDSILCGIVMSFALYLKGIGNIHASSVVLPSGAVGFIGVPGTGKSTFAASLVQAGLPLLSDDVLPLDQRGETFEAMSGFPLMGMTKATLDYAGLSVTDHEVAVRLSAGEKIRVPLAVVGGDFYSRPAPLRALYILSRQHESCSECSILTLPPHQAMQALFEHTPCFELLKATSLKFHWDFIAQVVSKVPVKVLSYPTGFDNLERAIDCVLREEQVDARTPAVS